MQSKNYLVGLTVGLLVTLTSCSGGSSGTDNNAPSNSDDASTQNANSEETAAVSDLIVEIPAGSVLSYGAITVGDESGMASDLVAAFFKLDKGISAEFLGSAFSSNNALCTVDDDDTVDFEEISVGFIPSFNGVSKQAISAGEAITLTSETGTYASLEIQSAGAFLFYTVPDQEMLPSGPVPTSLLVDVSGGEFPGYTAATMPTVEPLTEFNYAGENSITPKTVFSWTPGVVDGSMVRIFASTAGGFFLEDGMTVTCLAPDTGTFAFPTAIQEKLGADFIGGAPIVSRISVSTEATDNSLLFLIRESFLD